MDHSYGLHVHRPVAELALVEILEFLVVAADGRRWSSLVYDQRSAQVHRQSLAYLRQREIGAVDLCAGDMAGGHPGLCHNKCQRIRRDCRFGHVADENPCFVHEPLRRLGLVYLHPNMVWAEEKILAETYLLDWLAYTLCLQDRGNQQRNQAPARPTDLVGEQIPGLLQRAPLAEFCFAHILCPFWCQVEVMVSSGCLLSVDR